MKKFGILKLSLLFSLILGIVNCAKKPSRPALDTHTFNINEEAVPISQDDADKIYSEISEDIFKECGEAEQVGDIAPELVRDQGISGLCVGFSSLELVERNQYNRGNWSEAYSVLDYVSLADESQNIPFSNGVEDSDLLRGLQDKLELSSELKLPFPVDFFQEETIAELKKYFETSEALKDFDLLNYNLSLSSEILKKSKDANTHFKDFMDSLSVPLASFVLKNKSQNKKLKLLPFNFSHKIFIQSDFNLTLRSLFTSIKNKGGVRYGLCGIQLPGGKQRAIERGYPTNGCGPHAVNILNSRMRNGRCELLVSNSWGKKWGIRGRMWVDLKTVIASTSVDKKSQQSYVDLVSIEDASVSTAKRNHVLIYKNSKRILEYRGLLDSSGNLFDGTFYQLREDGTSEDLVYENGAIKESL